MLGKKSKFLPERSQAALEFIMTYGWAILVVIIAVVALAYFGVLSPDAFLPDKCTLASGIACLDYRVESYQTVLVLQNSKGEQITIDSASISANNQECSANISIDIPNNEKAILTITSCNNGAEGTKFNGVINLTYTIEGKLSHSVVGTLKTKVASGSSISSQNTCQNAQNSSLCDGLDIVYGIGYRDACCSEYGLCC